MTDPKNLTGPGAAPGVGESLPTDAEVRAAVERIGRFEEELQGCTSFQAGKSVVATLQKDLPTLLRAVQAQALRIAELEAERDEYRDCAVKQDYGRKDFICAMWTQVAKYEKDRAELLAHIAVAADWMRLIAEVLGVAPGDDPIAMIEALHSGLDSAESRARAAEAESKRYREALEWFSDAGNLTGDNLRVILGKVRKALEG